MDIIKNIQKKRDLKKSFISVKRANKNRHIRYMGYKVNKNRLNMSAGVFMVVLGSVTYPIPCGSIWFILLGLYLYNNPLSIKKILASVYNDIKFYVGCKW